jgi:hypothetical protein
MVYARHSEEARDPFIHAAAIDAGPKMASFDLARPFRVAGGGQQQIRVELRSQSSADGRLDWRSSKRSPVCEIGLQQSATHSLP